MRGLFYERRMLWSFACTLYMYLYTCICTCMCVNVHLNCLQVYCLGTILSMQISFVGFQPVQSSEHMAVSPCTCISRCVIVRYTMYMYSYTVHAYTYTLYLCLSIRKSTVLFLHYTDCIAHNKPACLYCAVTRRCATCADIILG